MGEQGSVHCESFDAQIMPLMFNCLLQILMDRDLAVEHCQGCPLCLGSSVCELRPHPDCQWQTSWSPLVYPALVLSKCLKMNPQVGKFWRVVTVPCKEKSLCCVHDVFSLFVDREVVNTSSSWWSWGFCQWDLQSCPQEQGFHNQQQHKHHEKQNEQHKICAGCSARASGTWIHLNMVNLCSNCPQWLPGISLAIKTKLLDLEAERWIDMHWESYWVAETLACRDHMHVVQHQVDHLEQSIDFAPPLQAWSGQPDLWYVVLTTLFLFILHPWANLG